MIWCVVAAEFEQAMASAGFALSRTTALHRYYTKGDVVVTIRWRGGSLTVQEIDRAFNDADLDPPEMDQIFSD